MMSVRADSYLSWCHTYVTLDLVNTYLCMHDSVYTYLQLDVGCTHTLQCRMYVYLANTCRVDTHLCIANVTTKY